MPARTAFDLLPAVRRYVLRQAAEGHTIIWLSMVTFTVDAPLVLGNPQAKHVARRWCWAGAGQKRASKLGHRGWVQACLSKLAKEGLLYERTRPEANVMYEPVDKVFRIRISQQQATKRLQC